MRYCHCLSNRWRAVSSYDGSDAGAALTEFALTLPFLLLMIFGIFEIGLLLGQMTTSAQASYEALIAGSRVIPAQAPQRMAYVRDLFDRHVNRHMERFEIADRTTAALDSQDMIKVDASADLGQLPKMFPFDLDLNLTGPRFGQALTLDVRDQFAVLNNQYYNCSCGRCEPGTICSQQVCTSGCQW